MKRIIIFGASSGIGAELAKSYAAEGNMVAVAARREEMLKELQREYPINIITFRADMEALPQEEGGNPEENPRGRFLEMLEAQLPTFFETVIPGDAGGPWRGGSGNLLLRGGQTECPTGDAN